MKPAQSWNADGYRRRSAQLGTERQFIIDHNGIAVRIEITGLFGASRFSPFMAHIVDRSKLFLSETGVPQLHRLWFIPDMTRIGSSRTR